MNDSACYTRYQVVSVCTALHAMYGAFIGVLSQLHVLAGFGLIALS